MYLDCVPYLISKIVITDTSGVALGKKCFLCVCVCACVSEG